MSLIYLVVLCYFVGDLFAEGSDRRSKERFKEKYPNAYKRMQKSHGW